MRRQRHTNPLPPVLCKNHEIDYSVGRARMSEYQQETVFNGSLPDHHAADEYKDYEKKFENTFGNDKEEMSQLSGVLISRIERMEEFAKELGTAELDTILFKNRLAREISDACNDLKEAQNNILVLMNDRSILKDQFCLLHMKIKKLKGFNKSFQEDLQA